MSVNLKRISIAAAAMLLAVAMLSAVVSFGASRTSQAASPPTLLGRLLGKYKKYADVPEPVRR
jgi:hypothetical protein